MVTDWDSQETKGQYLERFSVTKQNSNFPGSEVSHTGLPVPLKSATVLAYKPPCEGRVAVV